MSATTTSRKDPPDMATIYTASITNDGEIKTEVTVSTADHPNATETTAKGTAYAQWIVDHGTTHQSIVGFLSDHNAVDDSAEGYLEPDAVIAALLGDPEASEKVYDWATSMSTGVDDYYSLDAYCTAMETTPMTREALVAALAEYQAEHPGEDMAALVAEATQATSASAAA